MKYVLFFVPISSKVSIVKSRISLSLGPNNSDHHYPMDKNEFDTLPSYGWIAEGVAFFSADKDNPENVILHRLYNPNAEGAGSHHYTADTNERDTLVAQGWKYEGTAWAGLKN